MMTSINEKLKSHNDDPTWYFIAEFSLSTVACGESMAAELTAGPLFHRLRELGLPPEYLKRIEGTITETAKGLRRPINHSLPDLPVRICLFCSRKTMESGQHSGDPMCGGWGYYLVERSGGFSNVTPQESCRVVELYLYKERE